VVTVPARAGTVVEEEAREEREEEEEKGEGAEVWERLR
jgi:hypothetical protein